MTPFGARLRALRAARGMTLKDLAARLQVSTAYLSALEHGKRGVPSVGLVQLVCEAFGLIPDQAEELARLVRLSRPRVVLDSAGLTPEHTVLANRLGQSLRRLPSQTVVALLALLESAAPLPAKPRVSAGRPGRLTPAACRDGKVIAAGG